MTKLKTAEEKKKYILKHWKASDGKKIEKMLKRYWSTTSSKNRN